MESLETAPNQQIMDNILLNDPLGDLGTKGPQKAKEDIKKIKSENGKRSSPQKNIISTENDFIDFDIKNLQESTSKSIIESIMSELLQEIVLDKNESSVTENVLENQTEANLIGSSICDVLIENVFEDQTFRCDVCDFSCASRKGLGVHRFRRHTIQGKRNQDEVPEKKSRRSEGVTVVEQRHVTDQASERSVDATDLPIQCDLCDAKCKSQNGLGVHKYRSHNITSRRHQLKIDNKTSIEKEFRIELHGFQCRVCDNFRATSSDLIKDHYNENHRSRETSFNCSICGKAVNSSRSLKFHKRVLHGNGIKKIFKDKSAECSICKLTISSKSNLQRHLKSVHGVSRNIQSGSKCSDKSTSSGQIVVNLSDEREERSNLKTDIQSDINCGEEVKKNQMEIDDCHNVQTSKEKTTVIKISSSDKKFKCRQCDAIISRKANLSRHIRTFHEGKTTENVKEQDATSHRKFECSVCNSKFVLKSSLLRHNQTAHSALVSKKKKKQNPAMKCKPDEGDLDCQIIKEVNFSSENNRRRIKSKKEKAKSLSANEFKCSICLKLVSGRKALIRHKLGEHGSKKERRKAWRSIMYECPRCDVRVMNIALLQIHEKEFH